MRLAVLWGERLERWTLQLSGKRLAVAWLVLSIIYSVAPVRMQTDTIWVIPTAISLATDGDAELSEYGEATAQNPHGLTRSPTGGIYSTFPIGNAALATPLVWLTGKVAHVLAALPTPLDRPFTRWLRESAPSPGVSLGFFDTTEVLISSAIVAAGIVAFFLLCRAFSSSKTAFLLSLALALGTPALSTWTRGLWSHAPAFSGLAIAAAALATGRALRRTSALIGLAIAFAVISRPTAALPALVLLSIHVLLKARKRQVSSIAITLAGVLLVLGPWVFSSWRTWGTVLPPYYSPQRLESSLTDSLGAMAGQLFSPSRGLFVFVPILLLCVGLPFVRKRIAVAHLIALALGLAHVVLVSRFPHWWGGHSYGPRLSSDAVPFLLFATLPVVDSFLEGRGRRVVLAAMIGWGLFTNVVGATRKSTWRWNGTPVDVDANPDRLWDWSDPQFLR